MTQTILHTILLDAFTTLLLVAGPIVLIALVVGFLISIFQATTHIQEQTLTFVPKLAAIILTLIFMGPYFINVLTEFMGRIFEYINLITH